MATKDFKAERIRLAKIIGSGTVGTPWVQFYDDSNASDYIGGITDSNMLQYVGAEVGFFVSGSKNGRDNAVAGGVALFGGDLVVSGTIYADKQVIEVEESVTGSFSVSGSLFVSGGMAVGSGSLQPGELATFVGGDGSVAVMTLKQFNESTDAPNFNFAKARGTVAAPATINTLDLIGEINFEAYDGDSWDSWASIRVKAKGTCSDTSHPSEITFWTANETGTTKLARMKIGRDGRVLIGGTVDSYDPAGEIDVYKNTSWATIMITSDSDYSSSLAFRHELLSPTAAALVLGPDDHLLLFNSGSNKDINFQVASQALPSLSIEGSGHVATKQILLVSGGTYFKELGTDMNLADGDIGFYAKDDSGVTKLYFRNSEGVSELGSTTIAGGWTDNGTTVHPTTSTDYVAIGRSNATSNFHVQGAGSAGILIAAPGINSASLAFTKGVDKTTGAAIVYEADESLTIVNSGSNDDFAIKLNSGGTLYSAMTFDAGNKRVGVGTGTPASFMELQVADAANDDGLLIDFNETGNYHALKIDSEAAFSAIQVSGTKAGEFIQDGSGGYGLDVSRNIAEAGSNPLVTITDSNASNTQTTLEVRQAGTGDILNLFDGVTEVLTVLDGGNVGIGPTNPGYKLDVTTSTPGTFVIRGANVADNTSGGVILLENTRGGNAGIIDDYIGGIGFAGRNSFGDAITYAKITTTIKTPAESSEAGKIEFRVTHDGDEVNYTPLNLYGDMVHILSGGADSSYDESSGLDVAFYVSGSTSSKDTTTRGTAVFGGDLMVSGTIYDSVGSLANSGWQDDGTVIRLQTVTDKIAIGRTNASAKLDVHDLGGFGSTILVRAAANNSGSLAFSKGINGATAAGIVLGPDEDLLIFNSGSNKDISFQIANETLPSLKINGDGAVDAKLRLLLSGGTYFKETATDLTPKGINEVALYAKDDGGVTKLYFRNSDGISKIPGSEVAAGWTDAGTTIHPTTSTDFVALGRSSASAKLHVFDTGNFGSTILISAKANNSGSLAFSKGTNGATAAGISLGPVQDLLIYNSGSGNDINFQIAGETTPSLQISGSAAVVAKSRMILSGGVYFKEQAAALTPAASNEIALYAKDDSGVTKLYFKNSSGEQSIGGGWNDAGSVIHASTNSDKVAIGRTTASAKLHLEDTTAFGATILISAAGSNSGSLAFNKGAAGSFGATAAGISLGPTEDLLIFNSGSLKDINFQVASQTLPSIKINAAGNLDIKLKSLVSGGMYFKEQASGLAPQQNNELSLYAKDDGGVTKLYFSNSVGEQAAGGAFTMAGTEVYPNSATTTNVLIGDTSTANADIILQADGGAIFNEQGASVDFRIQSNLKENAFLVDGSADRVLILSGGGVTSTNNAIAADVAFYVSGSKGISGTGTIPGAAVFGGDTVVSGAVHIGRGTSGISTLNVYADVSGEYAATIDNDNASSGHVLKLLTDGNGSASRLLEMEDGDGDVLFRARADGRFGFGPTGVSSMGAGTFVVGIDGGHTADIAISKRLQHLGDSDTYMDFPAVDEIQFVAGNVNMVNLKEDRVLILSGGGVTSTDESTGADVAFYVSGSVGSQSTPVKGTSLFGGDMVVSGTMFVSGTIQDLYNTNSYLEFQSGHTNSVKLVAGGVQLIARDAAGSPDTVSINAGEAAVSTLIKTNAKFAFASKHTTNTVYINSDNASEDGADTSFYVSGSIGSMDTTTKGTSTFGGDLVVSGGFKVDASTLVVDESNSRVGVGTDSPSYNLDVADSNAPAARFLNNANNAFGGLIRLENNRGGSIAGQVDDFCGGATFNAPNSAASPTQFAKISSKIVSPAAGVEIGSITFETATGLANKGNPLFMRADRVLVLSGGAVGSIDEANGADVAFYVSGTIDSSGTGNRGTSLFGGDVVVSGTLAPAGMKWKTSTIQTSDFNYATNMGTLVQFNTTGGAITGTLPTSATVGPGRLVIFKDVGGFAGNSGLGFLIDPGGSDTVDGLTTGAKIQINSGSLQLMSDGGTSWFIVGSSN